VVRKPADDFALVLLLCTLYKKPRGHKIMNVPIYCKLEGPIESKRLNTCNCPIIMISLKVSPPLTSLSSSTCFLLVPIYDMSPPPCHFRRLYCSKSAGLPPAWLGSSFSYNAQIRTHLLCHLAVAPASCAPTPYSPQLGLGPSQCLALLLCPFRIHGHSHSMFLVTEHIHMHGLT